MRHWSLIRGRASQPGDGGNASSRTCIGYGQSALALNFAGDPAEFVVGAL